MNSAGELDPFHALEPESFRKSLRAADNGEELVGLLDDRERLLLHASALDMLAQEDDTQMEIDCAGCSIPDAAVGFSYILDSFYHRGLNSHHVLLILAAARRCYVEERSDLELCAVALSWLVRCV